MVSAAPIIVHPPPATRHPPPATRHPPLGTGGRRVTARGKILGLAHSDADVIEFLRRAGLEGAEGLLDDPAWVKWRGGRAHHYEAA